MNWVDEGIESYYQWLKDNTAIKEDNETGWFSISTPFIGLFNDNIEIFAKKEGDKITLSDDGQTISNLSLLGIDIARSSKRKKFINCILNNYGITLGDGELIVNATKKDFPQKKHALISAISDISDLDVTAKSTIESVFYEDVKEYLEKKEIIFTSQFIAKGSTGLDFCFDFQIAGKKTEMVIKSFNSLNQGAVERFLFSWQDIKETRESQTNKVMRSLAIINDATNSPKKELLNAFNSKNAEFFLWSMKDKKESANILDVA
jgi:hypothetical protein